MDFKQKVLAKYQVGEQEADAVREYNVKHAERDAEDDDNYKVGSLDKYVKDLGSIQTDNGTLHMHLFEYTPAPTRRKRLYFGPDELKIILSTTTDTHEPGVGSLLLGRIPPYEENKFGVKLVVLRPEWRGKGLAEKLYKAAVQHLGELYSDILVSKKAGGIWDRLAKDDKLNVEFATKKTASRHRLTMKE